MAVANAERDLAAKIVAVVADVDVEKAVRIEVEDHRRPRDEPLAPEPRVSRHVLEARPADVPVETIVVVRVGDQDVLAPVVVEVRDDRIAGLGVAAVGAQPFDSGFPGRVAEDSAAVVQQQRVSGSPDEQKIDVGVSIDILCGDSAARECGRRLQLLVAELAEPGRRAVVEIDAHRGGYVAKEGACVNLLGLAIASARGRGGCDPALRLGDLGCGVVPAGAVADDGPGRLEICRLKANGIAAFARDDSRHAQEKHTVLRDALGENLRRKGIRQDRIRRRRVGRPPKRPPMPTEVPEGVAVEGL